jgi:type IV fimbrial biogenesis protein FimT
MRRVGFQGHGGFTMIEMMIVLVLLGVLAAFAAPAFTGALERSRLRGAVDDVVSLINSSRQFSVKQDRDVNLTFRGTSAAWCVGARAAADPVAGTAVAAAAACNCATNAALCLVDGSQAVVSRTGLEAFGRAPTIDAADIAVVFDRKLGTLQDFATAGNVILTSPSGDYQVQIEVFALGQARACIPAGAFPLGGYRAC